jgi:hypothetical protein
MFFMEVEILFQQKIVKYMPQYQAFYGNLSVLGNKCNVISEGLQF